MKLASAAHVRCGARGGAHERKAKSPRVLISAATVAEAGSCYCAWTDVYAVGAGGTIIHFDGSAWTNLTSLTNASLYGVWGNGPTDVYAVGDSGTILHLTGAGWTSLESGTTADLRGVWGSGPTDVVVIGAGGEILRRR